MRIRLINRSCLFFSDSSVVGTSEERSVDLWNRCMKCHPDGFTIDADYAYGFRITPLATLRHVLWDDLIHLRSIRLHRKPWVCRPYIQMPPLAATLQPIRFLDENCWFTSGEFPFLVIVHLICINRRLTFVLFETTISFQNRR